MSLVLVTRAAALAARAHSGQKRKYKEQDYFVHPCRVAHRVAELLGDPVAIAAAYLHDVLEDTAVPDAEIVAAVGEDVARLVRELTNPSKGSPLSRQLRKQMDRDHLRTVSATAKIIKLIDRIDNLRDMTAAPTGFLRLYVEESRALAEVVGEAHAALHQELLRAIDTVDQSAR